MSSVADVLALLRSVEDQLDEARGQLRQGRTSLDEAAAALTRLDPDHPETVVPPGMHRADEQIERTQSLVEHASETVRGFSERL